MRANHKPAWFWLVFVKPPRELTLSLIHLNPASLLSSGQGLGGHLAQAAYAWSEQRLLAPLRPSG